MKKIILILLLGIVSVIQATAQADCIFEYRYAGSIATNTKKSRNNNIMILLPSPEFMLNIVGKKRGFRKAEINDQLKYESTSWTIESSVFCKSKDMMIEKILKGNQKFYTIYILKGKRKYKRKIHIQDIQFSYKDGLYYIKLPPIKI